MLRGVIGAAVGFVAAPFASAEIYCGQSMRGAAVYAGTPETSCGFALNTAAAHTPRYGNGWQPSAYVVRYRTRHSPEVNNGVVAALAHLIGLGHGSVVGLAVSAIERHRHWGVSDSAVAVIETSLEVNVETIPIAVRSGGRYVVLIREPFATRPHVYKSLAVIIPVVRINDMTVYEIRESIAVGVADTDASGPSLSEVST